MYGIGPLSQDPYSALPAAGGPGSQTLTDGGAIASAEAFGTGRIQEALFAGGAIASAEAFGVARVVEVLLAIAGIPSAEAFGTGLLAERILAGGGIPSGEAFGVGNILEVSDLTLTDGGGIPSEEAFGVGAILEITPVLPFKGSAWWRMLHNVDKTDKLPTPVPMVRLVAGGGISSGEAFGVGAVIERAPKPDKKAMYARSAALALALAEEEIYA